MIDRDYCMEMSYHIPGWLWPSEQGWLYDNLTQSKLHLEVGTFCGKSLYAASGGMNEASVIAVDPFICPTVNRKWCRRVWETTADLIRDNANVELIEKGSVEAFETFARRGIKLDSVFIDGDHNYAECKADIEMWSTVVKPGGMICGHDYWANDPGVMNAVNETGHFNVATGTRIWYRTAH